MSNAPQTTNMMMDMQLFLYSMDKWHEKEGLTNSFSRASTLVEFDPANITAFTAERIGNIANNIAGSDDLDTSKLPQEMIDKIQQRLSELGKESVLDDGIIDRKEFIEVASASGHTKMSEGFDISESEYNKATSIVTKVGIEDPDGSIARGLAIQIHYKSIQANEGLGFTPDGHPLPTPEVAKPDALSADKVEDLTQTVVNTGPVAFG